MAKELRLRRGTTVQHSTFTGAEGEVTIDTSKDTLVVHDGVTIGGNPMATKAEVDAADSLKQNVATAVQKDSQTGAAYIPSGTTAQRPITPSTGYLRFNTDLAQAEMWNGTAWSPVGGGSEGGGTDNVFMNTEYTVNFDYTIKTGKSAITISDSNNNVTIADGVTVTIEDGAKWVIL